MTPLALLIVLGAVTARLTRLVRDDTILDGPRGRLQVWLSDGGRVRAWFDKMLWCPWCVSGWIAIAATLIADWQGPVPLPGLFWLAVWWAGNLGYWTVELIAEKHEQIWIVRGYK